MISYFDRRRFSWKVRLISAFLILTFTTSTILPPSRVSAQTILNLPLPGVMVPLSQGFNPAVIKGIKIYPTNPLRFDFVIDTGESGLKNAALEEESTRLIKYFLATLTVPENDLWVNLSPYEKDRIIPNQFGTTEMGRDLLAQDYILKQLTASLIYPEDDLGKSFWDRVYKKAEELYHTKDIPVNTFNKVWIVPEKAVVYENGDMAFVIESHLKVMLESDYMALKENISSEKFGTDQLKKDDVQKLNDVSSQVVREIVIPEIEKEVNEGKNFANLRQIYSSMILATWFKRNLRKSILGKIYVGQNKVSGVDVEDKAIKEKIYKQYVEAFKKGVYNYIKDDYDPNTQEIIPRKYFSGGFVADEAVMTKAMSVVYGADNAMLVQKAVDPDNAMMVEVKLNTIGDNDQAMVTTPPAEETKGSSISDIGRNRLASLRAASLAREEFKLPITSELEEKLLHDQDQNRDKERDPDQLVPLLKKLNDPKVRVLDRSGSPVSGSPALDVLEAIAKIIKNIKLQGKSVYLTELVNYLANLLNETNNVQIFDAAESVFNEFNDDIARGKVLAKALELPFQASSEEDILQKLREGLAIRTLVGTKRHDANNAYNAASGHLEMLLDTPEYLSNNAAVKEQMIRLLKRLDAVSISDNLPDIENNYQVASISAQQAEIFLKLKTELDLIAEQIEALLQPGDEQKLAERTDNLTPMAREGIKNDEELIIGSLKRAGTILVDQVTVNRIKVNLRKLIAESNKWIPKRQFDIEFQGDSDHEYYLDPDKMKSVFENLFKNAYEAIPAERKDDFMVNVIVRKNANGKLVIQVKDNGPGIPAAIRPTVFGQGVSTKLQKGGSGLGLFSVRNIIEAHDGNISVESKTVDELVSGEPTGTTFTIELPDEAMLTENEKIISANAEALKSQDFFELIAQEKDETGHSKVSGFIDERGELQKITTHTYGEVHFLQDKDPAMDIGELREALEAGRLFEVVFDIDSQTNKVLSVNFNENYSERLQQNLFPALSVLIESIKNVSLDTGDDQVDQEEDLDKVSKTVTKNDEETIIRIVDSALSQRIVDSTSEPIDTDTTMGLGRVLFMDSVRSVFEYIRALIKKRNGRSVLKQVTVADEGQRKRFRLESNEEIVPYMQHDPERYQRVLQTTGLALDILFSENTKVEPYVEKLSKRTDKLLTGEHHIVGVVSIKTGNSNFKIWVDQEGDVRIQRNASGAIEAIALQSWYSLGQEASVLIGKNILGQYTIQVRDNSSTSGTIVELNGTQHDQIRLEAVKLSNIRSAVGYHNFQDVSPEVVLGTAFDESLPKEVRAYFLSNRGGHKILEEYVDDDLIRDVINELGGKSDRLANIVSQVRKYLMLVYDYENAKNTDDLKKLLFKLVYEYRSYKFSKVVEGRVKTLLGDQWVYGERKSIAEFNPSDAEIIEANSPAEFMTAVQGRADRLSKVYVYKDLYQSGNRLFMLIARDGQFELYYSSNTYSQIAGQYQWERQETTLATLNNGQVNIRWYAKPIVESAHDLTLSASLGLNKLLSKLTVKTSSPETKEAITNLHVELGLAAGLDGFVISRNSETGELQYGNPLNLQVDRDNRYSSWINFAFKYAPDDMKGNIFNYLKEHPLPSRDLNGHDFLDQQKILSQLGLGFSKVELKHRQSKDFNFGNSKAKNLRFKNIEGNKEPVYVRIEKNSDGNLVVHYKVGQTSPEYTTFNEMATKEGPIYFPIKDTLMLIKIEMIDGGFRIENANFRKKIPLEVTDAAMLTQAEIDFNEEFKDAVKQLREFLEINEGDNIVAFFKEESIGEGKQIINYKIGLKNAEQLREIKFFRKFLTRENYQTKKEDLVREVERGKIAYGEGGRNRLGSKTELVYIDGNPNVVTYNLPGIPFTTIKRSENLYRDLGSSLGRLHARGIVHGDLIMGGGILKGDHIRVEIENKSGEVSRIVRFLDFGFVSNELTAEDEKEEVLVGKEEALIKAFNEGYEAGQRLEREKTASAVSVEQPVRAEGKGLNPDDEALLSDEQVGQVLRNRHDDYFAKVANLFNATNQSIESLREIFGLSNDATIVRKEKITGVSLVDSLALEKFFKFTDDYLNIMDLERKDKDSWTDIDRGYYFKNFRSRVQKHINDILTDIDPEKSGKSITEYVRGIIKAQEELRDSDVEETLEFKIVSKLLIDLSSLKTILSEMVGNGKSTSGSLELAQVVVGEGEQSPGNQAAEDGSKFTKGAVSVRPNDEPVDQTEKDKIIRESNQAWQAQVQAWEVEWEEAPDKSGLDKGQYVAKKIGINPQLVPAGITFSYPTITNEEEWNAEFENQKTRKGKSIRKIPVMVMPGVTEPKYDLIHEYLHLIVLDQDSKLEKETLVGFWALVQTAVRSDRSFYNNYEYFFNQINAKVNDLSLIEKESRSYQELMINFSEMFALIAQIYLTGKTMEGKDVPWRLSDHINLREFFDGIHLKDEAMVTPGNSVVVKLSSQVFEGLLKSWRVWRSRQADSSSMAASSLPVGNVLAVSQEEDGFYKLRIPTMDELSNSQQVQLMGEIGVLLEWMKKYPAHLKQLGITQDADGIISYPATAKLFNKYLEKFGSALRFDPVDGKISQFSTDPSIKDYAHGLMKNRTVPLARAGHMHFHDMFVHGFGYSLYPKVIIDSVQAQLEVLIALYESDLVLSDPELSREIRYYIERGVIEVLDNVSSYIVRDILTDNLFDLTMQFEGLTSFTTTELLLRKVEQKFGPQEFTKQRALVEQYKPLALSEAQVKEVIKSLIEKLDRLEKDEAMVTQKSKKKMAGQGPKTPQERLEKLLLESESLGRPIIKSDIIDTFIRQSARLFRELVAGDAGALRLKRSEGLLNTIDAYYEFFHGRTLKEKDRRNIRRWLLRVKSDIKFLHANSWNVSNVDELREGFEAQRVNAQELGVSVSALEDPAMVTDNEDDQKVSISDNRGISRRRVLGFASAMVLTRADQALARTERWLGGKFEIEQYLFANLPPDLKVIYEKYKRTPVHDQATDKKGREEAAAILEARHAPVHEASYVKAYLVPIEGLEANTGVRFHFGVGYFGGIGFVDAKDINDEELINYYFKLQASGAAITTMPTLLAGVGFYLYERFRRDSVFKEEAVRVEDSEEPFDEIGSWKKFRTMLKLSSFTVLGAFGMYTKEVYGKFFFSEDSYIGDIINSKLTDSMAVPGFMAAFYAILPLLIDESRSDKAKLRALRYITATIMLLNMNFEFAQGVLPWAGWYDPQDMLIFAGTGLASIFFAKYLPFMTSKDLNFYYQTLRHKLGAKSDVKESPVMVAEEGIVANDQSQPGAAASMRSESNSLDDDPAMVTKKRDPNDLAVKVSAKGPTAQNNVQEAQRIVSNLKDKSIRDSAGKEYQLIAEVIDEDHPEFDPGAGVLEVQVFLNTKETGRSEEYVLKLALEEGNDAIAVDYVDVTQVKWQKREIVESLKGKKISSALFQVLGQVIPTGKTVTGFISNDETLDYLRNTFSIDEQGDLRSRDGLRVVDRFEGEEIQEGEMSIDAVLEKTLIGGLMKNHAGLRLIKVDNGSTGSAAKINVAAIKDFIETPWKIYGVGITYQKPIIAASAPRVSSLSNDEAMTTKKPDQERTSEVAGQGLDASTSSTSAAMGTRIPAAVKKDKKTVREFEADVVAYILGKVDQAIEEMRRAGYKEEQIIRGLGMLVGEVDNTKIEPTLGIKLYGGEDIQIRLPLHRVAYLPYSTNNVQFSPFNVSIEDIRNRSMEGIRERRGMIINQMQAAASGKPSPAIETPAVTATPVNQVETAWGAKVLSTLDVSDITRAISSSEPFEVENLSSGESSLINPPYYWPHTQTEFEDINQYLHILDKIRVLHKARTDVNKPIVILDWGCGTGTALSSLLNRLTYEGIPNVKLYGYSNQSYGADGPWLAGSWHDKPKELTFVFDTPENLMRILREDGITNIDLVYSHKGLVHFLMNEGADRVVKHFSQLRDILAPGTEVLTGVQVNKQRIFDAGFISTGEYTYVSDASTAAAVRSKSDDNALVATKPTGISSEASAVSQAAGPLKTENKGGIDLNPALLDLKTKGQGADFILPEELKNLETMPINGFVPVIIQIVPITNLPMLLGISQQQDATIPELSSAK